MFCGAIDQTQLHSPTLPLLLSSGQTPSSPPLPLSRTPAATPRAPLLLQQQSRVPSILSAPCSSLLPASSTARQAPGSPSILKSSSRTSKTSTRSLLLFRQEAGPPVPLLFPLQANDESTTCSPLLPLLEQSNTTLTAMSRMRRSMPSTPELYYLYRTCSARTHIHAVAEEPHLAISP